MRLTTDTPKNNYAIDGKDHEHYYSAMVILKDEEGKKDG